MARYSKQPVATVVRKYNRCLIDMSNTNGAFKKASEAAGHKAINPTSMSYILHAVQKLPRSTMVATNPCVALECAGVLAFEPIKGVNIRVILEGGDADAVSRFLYKLATLCVTFTVCQDVRRSDSNDVLVSRIQEVMARVQSGEDINTIEAFDCIMEYDIVMLLEHLGSVSAKPKPEPKTKPEPKPSANSSFEVALLELLCSLTGAAKPSAPGFEDTLLEIIRVALQTAECAFLKFLGEATAKTSAAASA